MERNFLVGTFECWDVYTATVSQGGSMKCKSSVRMIFSCGDLQGCSGGVAGFGKVSSLRNLVPCDPLAIAVLGMAERRVSWLQRVHV